MVEKFDLQNKRKVGQNYAKKIEYGNLIFLLEFLERCFAAARHHKLISRYKPVLQENVSRYCRVLI